jgi:hypothetical protein
LNHPVRQIRVQIKTTSILFDCLDRAEHIKQMLLRSGWYRH